MHGDGWWDAFMSGLDFVGRYPSYAFVLAKMKVVKDPSVPVMSVSFRNEHFYLRVNTAFFEKYAECRAGVMLHEVHHVVFGHLTDSKFRGVVYPDMMELAMEISANEYIREQLPGSPPVVREFSEFGVQPGQSTLERYHLLAKARREEKAVMFLPGLCVDSHQVAGGIGEALSPDAPAETPGGERVLRDIVEELTELAEKTPEFKGPSGRIAGREPGQLVEELEGVDEEPDCPMDWKTAVQIFVSQVRRPACTYSWPSRRFPDKVGIIPGRRRFTASSSDHPRVLVAIDTSGSMKSGTLAEIARQLLPLSGFVRMTVVECDVVVHRVYIFLGRIDGTPREMAGRGGTDLRPVFEPEFLREHRPDGVIYFTDGYGPFPPKDPGIKTLWVLTHHGGFACPWGERAVLLETSRKMRSPSAYVSRAERSVHT